MRKIISLTPVLFAIYGVILVCIGFFSKSLGSFHIQVSIAYALKHNNHVGVSSAKFFKSFFRDSIFGNHKFFSPDTYGLNSADKTFAIIAFVGCLLLLAALLLFLIFIVTLLIHRSIVRTQEVIANKGNKPAMINTFSKFSFGRKKQKNEQPNFQNNTSQRQNANNKTEEARSRDKGIGFKFGKRFDFLKFSKKQKKGDRKERGKINLFKFGKRAQNNKTNKEKKWKSFFHKK